MSTKSNVMRSISNEIKRHEIDIEIANIPAEGTDRSVIVGQKRPRNADPATDSLLGQSTSSPPTSSNHPCASFVNELMQERKRNVGELRFLGTGSAIPGKHRNVSSIFLDMFDRGCILLDCGEGSYGQLVRSLGIEQADDALMRMKLVWISHMHADHHLGLLQILSRCKQLKRQSPLRVAGPKTLKLWLATYGKYCERIEFEFFDNASLVDPQQPHADYFPQHIGLRLQCVDVVHCPLSYGLVIEDCVQHWKLVYSGDTRPCSALAEAGRDALVVIHEATFEDELSKEAVYRLHCTTSEAMDVCVDQMNAYRTILTHFSQRYPRVPASMKDYPAVIKKGTVGLAFDLMAVNFCDLLDLPQIVKPLNRIFPHDLEDDFVVD